MIDLGRDGDVFVVTMDEGENRFNRSFIDALNRALDEVESSTVPGALVTIGTGKFYSNGLDLDWLSTGQEDFAAFVTDVERLMARILGFPMPTVAALNGHCFAAGAMVALCHDIRLMRDDRGWFCLPEVDIQIPFTDGMNALIVGKLNPSTAHEAMVTGKRYPADEAVRAHIVSAAIPEHDLLASAVETAQSLAGKDRSTIATIKRRLYGGAIDLLNRSSGTAPPTTSPR